MSDESHDVFGDVELLWHRLHGRSIEIQRTIVDEFRVVLHYRGGEVDGYGDTLERAMVRLTFNAEKRKPRG